MIYLATPYTDPDPEIMEERFDNVNRLAGQYFEKGEYCYSPITYSRPIVLECDLPDNFEFWRKFDHYMLTLCCQLVVYCQPGWQTSFGVATEIAWARALRMPINYYKEI